MARKVRSNELENRTNRLKLPINKIPVYVKIGPSLSLGYRRNRTNGTWVMRTANGKGGMVSKAIGNADDYEASNGQTVLTFYEAQDQARSLRNAPVVKELTVKEAVDNYLIVLKSKNKYTAYDTELRLKKHFLSAKPDPSGAELKDRLVSSLTKTQIETWLSGLVSQSDDMEAVRKSKDSANRVLAMVKAALNHAKLDEAHNLNDNAWRYVKAFKNVGNARTIRYTIEEIKKIIENAPDKATGHLIKCACLSGCRYGEIVSAKVSSVDLHNKIWHVRGKTGARAIILQQSAVDFLKEMIKDKSADDFVLTMENGQPWQKSDQTRRIKAALEKAGLPTDGSLYAMRHSYVSASIENGIPLNLIADNAGTSVRMITKHYAHILAEKERAFIESGAPSL